MKFRRDKHGIVEDWLQFLFVVICLFFIFLFFVSKRSSMVSHIDNQLIEQKWEVEANQLLIYYLQTPLKEHKLYDNVGELVIASYYNDEDKLKLKALTIDFLNSLNKDTALGWDIDIKVMPDNERIIDAFKAKASDVLFGEKKIIESKVDVPLYDTDKYIRMRLYRECQPLEGKYIRTSPYPKC